MRQLTRTQAHVVRFLYRRPCDRLDVYDPRTVGSLTRLGIIERRGDGYVLTRHGLTRYEGLQSHS